jgi:hypothetical protein
LRKLPEIFGLGIAAILLVDDIFQLILCHQASAQQQPNNPKDPLSVFKPVMVKPNPDDINFGEEIAGKISKPALLREAGLEKTRVFLKKTSPVGFLFFWGFLVFFWFFWFFIYLPRREGF